MAKRVIAAGYGVPEGLALIEEPTPAPGPGEVQVQVRAAGVNPIDVKVYSGQFGTDPANLPIRLGAEAAGVVTAVGSGCVGPAGPVRPGDEVMLYPVDAAYASELVVPASSAVPKPADLDWARGRRADGQRRDRGAPARGHRACRPATRCSSTAAPAASG